jgi:hypothetical protein
LGFVISSAFVIRISSFPKTRLASPRRDIVTEPSLRKRASQLLVLHA